MAGIKDMDPEKTHLPPMPARRFNLILHPFSWAAHTSLWQINFHVSVKKKYCSDKRILNKKNYYDSVPQTSKVCNLYDILLSLYSVCLVGDDHFEHLPIEVVPWE